MPKSVVLFPGALLQFLSLNLYGFDQDWKQGQDEPLYPT
jgi:hypothetical protein